MRFDVAKRRSISKRTRFEIFKRENFTCAYCGKQPPATILHIDHIIAVANGGSNQDENLITSCVDCNLGKGTEPLTSKLPSIQEASKRKYELKEQLEEFAKHAQKLRDLKEEHVIKAMRYFLDNCFDEDQSGVIYVGETKQSFVCFLDRLPLYEIFDSIDKTIGRLGLIRKGGGDLNHFRYFCGVCWRKIKDPIK